MAHCDKLQPPLGLVARCDRPQLPPRRHTVLDHVCRSARAVSSPVAPRSYSKDRNILPGYRVHGAPSAESTDFDILELTLLDTPQHRVWLPPKNNMAACTHTPEWIDVDATCSDAIDWNAFGRNHPRVRAVRRLLRQS